MKECRAFEVELLSTKTNDSAQTKAHERYCSTLALSDPVSVEYDDAANETNHRCHVVYPGSGDDVEPHALDRTWVQLSNHPALVSYAVGLGDDVVGRGAYPFA